MSKYHNVPTEIDGERFDSKSEARRYGELRLLERAGEIRELELHPQFSLVVNGRKVATYEADFAYSRQDGRRVVEDVKGGVRTAAYVLKKKLMRACLGIEIVEVEA